MTGDPWFLNYDFWALAVFFVLFYAVFIWRFFR